MNPNPGVKILLVEDDKGLVNTLRPFLSDHGFQVEVATLLSEVMKIIHAMAPDLVLLDRRLPDGEGLDIMADIKKISGCCVILLTGMDDPIEKVVGLELGADDYITKPFHMRELLARIRTVLRRNHASGNQRNQDTVKGSRAHFFGWNYNLNSGDLQSEDGKEIQLTGAEHRLMNTLLYNTNEIVSKDQISKIISNRNWAPTDRSIDMLVSSLRKKIGDNPRKPAIIKTMRNMGYVFIASVDFE